VACSDGGGKPRRSPSPVTAASGGVYPHRLLPLLALLLAGCADCRFLKQACPRPPDPQAAAERPTPDAAYRIGCPDVLEVTFADHPEWDVYASVDLDGRLPLEQPGKPRAEGRTLDDVRRELAQLAGVSPERVGVRLAAPRSSHVYLHGPIRGRARVVPYQGPEPVIDFLKRIGGLPPGSKLSQVYVIRPNVAGGGRPEVFPVDVPGVLIANDQRTNVPLRPSDEVYVGETTRSVFARILPDWMAPVYCRLTGLLPESWWPLSRTRAP
jgi:protein involved in polysaccharide export with SLBB domain